MFKVIMVLVTLGFVMSGNANATLPNDKWHAEGVRMSVPINSFNTSHTVISVGGFDTQAQCEAFVQAQKDMDLGSVKGYKILSTVVAECSQTQ